MAKNDLAQPLPGGVSAGAVTDRLTEGSARAPIAGGILAAILASVCCVGPLVLVMLGVGGAWVGNLAALTPYSPIFVAVSVLFMGLAARRLFFAPQVCVPGTPCADQRTLRNQRIVFSLVAVALAALMAFPLYAPLFY
jgi:mercuric ion transport protein